MYFLFIIELDKSGLTINPDPEKNKSTINAQKVNIY